MLALLAFFYCLNLKISSKDKVIGHINFISKHHDKGKFELKFIQLVIIPNLDLLLLEVVQKMPKLSNLCLHGKTPLKIEQHFIVQFILRHYFRAP